MTDIQLEKFFIDNQDKFVFFSYVGGMGGEAVCNYLQRNTDYFYNETLIKDITLNKKYEFGELGYGTLEKNHQRDIEKDMTSLFRDYMFDSAFCDISCREPNTNSNQNDGDAITIRKMLSGNNTMKDFVKDFLYGFQNFMGRTQKTIEDHPLNSIFINCVFSGIDPETNALIDWRNRENPMDEVLERFAAQDKPYLIRLHGIDPSFSVFTKSKFIDARPGEWINYVLALVQAKVFLQPAPYQEAKEWYIDLCLETYGTAEEVIVMRKKIINFLGDDLYNDDMILMKKTIDVFINPEAYQIDLTLFKDMASLNDYITTLYMFYHHFDELLPYEMYFSNFYSVDLGLPPQSHGDIFWKIAREEFPDLYMDIDPIHYTMNDLFSGDWIKDQFGLDPTGMKEMMDKWHAKNIRLLGNMKISKAAVLP